MSASECAYMYDRSVGLLGPSDCAVFSHPCSAQLASAFIQIPAQGVDCSAVFFDYTIARTKDVSKILVTFTRKLDTSLLL